MALALDGGTRIGGFEVQSVIGRGGFGITYRATEERSGRTYAIKEYLPEDYARRDARGSVTSQPGQDDPYTRGLKAFLTEANILKDLPRRRGLVRVRGAFERSGTAYCVMEFIEGDSLDRMANRMIGRAGHVPEALLSDLALEALWALEALHAENLIHRDVKPANIMVRRSGQPVLIDFGAARRLTLTGDREMIFTRRYAALEQFPPETSGFGRRFDEGPWSDLYSLSVMLYEIIAHDLPPDAQTRAAAVLAGGADPYVPLAEKIAGTPRADEYSPEVLAAIDGGCSLMPRGRPRSARALAEALRPGAWAEMNAAELDTTPKHADQTRQAVTVPKRGGGVRLVLMLLFLVSAGLVALSMYQSHFQGVVF